MQKELGGDIPSFRPRFASKCDRQSSDLTQITSGYNFSVKLTTNHPNSSCSISYLRKFSSDILKGTGRIFEYFLLSPPSFELGYLSIRVGVSTN